MPRRVETITPDIIQSVKERLNVYGLREIARQLGISFYTVWCIKEGKYDSELPLRYNHIGTKNYFNYSKRKNWLI